MQFWVRLAVPVVAQRQVPGMVLTVQITVMVPQLQFIDVAVEISFAAQRQLPVWAVHCCEHAATSSSSLGCAKCAEIHGVSTVARWRELILSSIIFKIY